MSRTIQEIAEKYAAECAPLVHKKNLARIFANAIQEHAAPLEARLADLEEAMKTATLVESGRLTLQEKP